MLLELVPVVSVVELLLEALLVAVVELKLNFFPSTLTAVAGAFPNLKVMLVVPLGTVNEWEVDEDSVPCQVVVPPMVTATHALLVADNVTFGLLEAFFISQVEPLLVVLSCLKLAVFEEAFLEEDFFEAD